jgi:hypothetical protein
MKQPLSQGFFFLLAALFGAVHGTHATAEMTTNPLPRGIQLTHVTKDEVILCKAGSFIRNTYEIRLALFFAAKDKLHFVLRIPPNAKLEDSLKALIEAHGGVIEKKVSKDYSVDIGHAAWDGKESDSWVLGDNKQFESLQRSLKSTWLRKELQIGATFSGKNLLPLLKELQKESIILKNVDGENVQEALIQLIHLCEKEGGLIYIQ